MSVVQLRRDIAGAMEQIFDGQAARMLGTAKRPTMTWSEIALCQRALRLRLGEMHEIVDWVFSWANQPDQFILYWSMARLGMGTLYGDRCPEGVQTISEASTGIVDVIDWAKLALERDWAPLAPLDFVPVPHSRDSWPLRFERCRHQAAASRLYRVVAKVDPRTSVEQMRVRHGSDVKPDERQQFAERVRSFDCDVDFYRWIDRDADTISRWKLKLVVLNLSFGISIDETSEKSRKTLHAVERAQTDRELCLLALDSNRPPFG